VLRFATVVKSATPNTSLPSNTASYPLEIGVSVSQAPWAWETETPISSKIHFIASVQLMINTVRLIITSARYVIASANFITALSG
jgi:hypothetical protein